MQMEVKLTVRDPDGEEYFDLSENDLISLQESIRYELSRFSYITDSSEIVHVTIAKIEVNA